MDAKHLQILLERLECDKIKVTTGWVKASCPFAAYRPGHSKGTDNKPSFNIAIDEENYSGVICHTCHYTGNLIDFVEDLFACRFGKKISWEVRAKKLTPLLNFIYEHDEVSDEVRAAKIAAIPEGPPVWKEVAGVKVSPTHQPALPLGKPLELVTLPESALDAFKTITDEAWAWFEKRGLSPRAVKEWELGWHPKARRISIPVRDVQGRLVCISGRAVDPGVQPKFMHSKGFRRDFYLYGEHRCQTVGVGYLVEGFFDAIALWEKGYRNPLCFMGSSLSPFQAEKVTQMCSEVTIVPDGDEPGKEIASRVYQTIHKRIWKTRVIEVPDGTDPDQLSPAFLAEHLGPPQVH